MEIFRGVTCLQLNSECFSKKKKKHLYIEKAQVCIIFLESGWRRCKDLCTNFWKFSVNWKLFQDEKFGFPNGSVVKEYACNAEDTQKTWVWSLGWKDPLKKEMAPHSSILARKNPMDRGDWRATLHGAAKSQTWVRD